MKRYSFLISVAFIIILAACSPGQQEQQTTENTPGKAPEAATASADNGSLQLNNNFNAQVIADSIGRARHLVVRDNGDIYVKLRDTKKGGGIAALRDLDNDGSMDSIAYFGEYGGTGIHIYNNYLYYSSDTSVHRVSLKEGELVPTAPVETIIARLPSQQSHAAKPLAFDGKGNMYVTVGAPSNACQEESRTPGSPGQDPCPQLENHAGIWRFSDSKPNQTQEADGYRYCTGTRQIVALEWNDLVNNLYAVQHGRDQLSQLWPDYYNDEQSAVLPSEEFLKIDDQDNFGWPYCYNDHLQGEKVLAPEYGGDGKEIGRCEQYEAPIMAFPGHWAPNDLMFYRGDMMPEKYHNGAFIAFHGSWNRAPEPQAGYKVVFVPFEGNMPSGDYEEFADHFAGDGEDFQSPQEAEYRPMGLSQDKEGAIYVTDSNVGRIWKITYNDKRLASAE